MARTSEYGAHQQFKAQIVEAKLQNAQSIIEAQQDRIKQLMQYADADRNGALILGFMAGVLVTSIAAVVLM